MALRTPLNRNDQIMKVSIRKAVKHVDRLVSFRPLHSCTQGGAKLKRPKLFKPRCRYCGKPLAKGQRKFCNLICAIKASQRL